MDTPIQGSQAETIIAEADEHGDDGWPLDGGPLSFETISRPILHAIRFAYDLNRRDRRRNIPWRGPEIGRGERATCFLAKDRLKASNLSYCEDDQGRDTLEEIVGLAIQLGIEQGRRIARRDQEPLLDKAFGAVFTLSIGWSGDTHLHTQAGHLADPTDCLSKAIAALQNELAVVQRCPRERAIRPAQGGNADAPGA